jgi:putative nucleotidyltransferase with HDIG domain
VTSINEAIICLGTLKILQMVMAVHTTSILSAEQSGYGLAAGVLWKHSVAVALASSQVATRVRLPNVSLAFTAGLLHDIGKVVLNQYVADEFTEIIRRVSDEGLTFIEAERQILGYDHTQIGAMIGERWNLPEQIVETIRYHHEPGELNPCSPIVDAVYLANCVCLLLGIGLGADGLSYRADESVMRRHGLVEQDLESISMATLGELQNVLGMFDIEPANVEIRQPVGK